MMEKSKADYIKLIHTLKGRAGVSDSEYRTILRDVAGVTSSKDLDPVRCKIVVTILRGIGNHRAVLAAQGGGPECGGYGLPSQPKKSPSERMIWGLWYKLLPFLPDCDRTSLYLVGFIEKATEKEWIPNLVSGKKVNLAALDGRQRHKVIEALKIRIRYEEDRATVPF